MVLPWNSWPSVPHWAAPCISGGITSRTSGAGGGRALLGQLVVGGDLLAGDASMPWPSAMNTSSWRHITPLGMPVVPPV